MEKLVYVTVGLVIKSEEDFDYQEVVEECEYEFESKTDGVEIVDTEIFEVEECTL